MSMLGDAGSVIGGLINNGRSLPTVDISSLLSLINQNKAQNADLINNMPAELAPLYAAYTQSLNGAGTNLQTATDAAGNNLLSSTKALYDPNSAAVQATLAALKQQDYSTLPGTLNSLKSNLAATGGLGNGGATRAITSAVMAPAATYSQQAANVQGTQLQQQQTNVQTALNKIASMDDATAQSIFGMSKDQATTILNSGRQDLQQQLASLINNNNNAESQSLSAQGIAVNNGYQNAVTRNQQQAAVTNGLVNLGVDAGSSLVGGSSGSPAAGAGSVSPDALNQYSNVSTSGTSFPTALSM